MSSLFLKRDENTVPSGKICQKKMVAGPDVVQGEPGCLLSVFHYQLNKMFSCSSGHNRRMNWCASELGCL